MRLSTFLSLITFGIAALSLAKFLFPGLFGPIIQILKQLFIFIIAFLGLYFIGCVQEDIRLALRSRMRLNNQRQRELQTQFINSTKLSLLIAFFLSQLLIIGVDRFLFTMSDSQIFQVSQVLIVALFCSSLSLNSKDQNVSLLYLIWIVIVSVAYIYWQYNSENNHITYEEDYQNKYLKYFDKIVNSAFYPLEEVYRKLLKSQ